MKKTAVLLYETCCLFELTVALEMLKMADKPVVYFSRDLKPIRTEEKMLIIADKELEDLVIDDFDSLLITGGSDARDMIEDKHVHEFVRYFAEKDMVIGAISIAPLLLLKLGYLNGKSFMIGCNKEDLYEEGVTDKDMTNMVGWREACNNEVPEKYIKYKKIITSVAFGFRQWAIAIGEELGIETYPKSFDL